MNIPDNHDLIHDWMDRVVHRFAGPITRVIVQVPNPSGDPDEIPECWFTFEPMEHRMALTQVMIDAVENAEQAGEEYRQAVSGQ